MNNAPITNRINDIFIYTENKNISKELCKIIIEKFDNDNRKAEGITSLGVSDIKKTTDIFLSSYSDWKEIDNILFNSLDKAIDNYFNVLCEKHTNNDVKNHFKGVKQGKKNQDFGYQVQYYEQNTGYYKWHSDELQFASPLNQYRLLTFIWYLNDVEVGGETEFLNGSIKPVSGKILIFPATWTYVHRGNMPISNSKYIITGWIGNKLVDPDIFNYITLYKKNISLNIETP